MNLYASLRLCAFALVQLRISAFSLADLYAAAMPNRPLKKPRNAA
jgi:hypothetical protein